MDDDYKIFPRGKIFIEGSEIKKIGDFDLLPEDHYDEVFDADGLIILPGLVNTHVHTSQQLGRGLGDDVPLLTWLIDRIWPYESNLNEHSSFISTLLCCLEMVKSGVTTFAEAGGQYVDGMGRGVKQAGIKGILAQSVMDIGEGLPSGWSKPVEALIEDQTEIFNNWHNKAGERIKVWFGLRTIFNNSQELILRTKQTADDLGVGVHMHVAEIPEENQKSIERNGLSTVRFLKTLGVLDSNFLAIHCVWMDEEEIEIFAEKGVKVSHNPASALRVLGSPKIPEMMEKDIVVGLGTDGAPTNNRMNIVDEMWLTSLIHKGRLRNPTAMPAEDVLKMATINGAKALNWENEIGSLVEGKKADIIFIDPDSPNMLPVHDIIANLVTAMNSENIKHMICDGSWVMKDREVLTIDEENLYKEVKEVAGFIREKIGYHSPDRFKKFKG